MNHLYYILVMVFFTIGGGILALIGSHHINNECTDSNPYNGFKYPFYYYLGLLFILAGSSFLLCLPWVLV